MKPIPYLKQVLRELDTDLRKFPRGERAVALDAYRHGLETSFHDCYPDRFAAVDSAAISEGYRRLFERGDYVAKQFGELEVDFARRLLLAEVEKRKTKFSGPGWFERYLGRYSKMVNPWEWL